MSLRTRTLGIFVAAHLALAAIVYVSSSTIILDRFNEVEADEASEDLERAREAINVEVSRLESVAGDWAPWTDTYNFLLGEDDTYPEVNLGDETLASLKIDMMLFYDAEGGLFYGKEIDPVEGSEISLSADATAAVASAPGLLQAADSEATAAGLVLSPGGAPLLVASYPITTSERTGSVAGTLVVARWLGDNVLADLATTTRLAISTYSVDSGTAAAESPPVLAPGENYLDRVNADQLIAYTTLSDVNGNPAIGLAVELPRTVYAEGQQAVRYLLLALLVIGLAFAAIAIGFLETSVIRPVRRLSSFVAGVKGRLSERTPDLGRDEVGTLGRAVNEMLSSLEESAAELNEVNAQLKAERQIVEELNRSLEAKVAKRTEDLLSANDELRERNRQLIDARTQAATDGLTGLGNHRAFHEAIRTSTAAPTAAMLAVLMADIDNFKQINDTHGHQVGDRILGEMGIAIRDAIENGTVYRYGGDEFAVITAIHSVEDAEETAERVRAFVADRLKNDGLSVSVGIAVRSDPNLSAEEVIYQADAAMYAAKSAGKNRVRVWTPDVTVPAIR